ncbi:hypothetical protein M011DRAFT_468947 [Sporormia fimetaria CBS 119925]|uniref:ceramidase n=1 Tax=Sporormia fimetaria CBS 119925 TaxID=1340428 RepID=A0A6A6V6F9_9PLEO|nr:hypothetical protein M011DRAFT_468947 [Sporormia fimetaria CBS 119925]
MAPHTRAHTARMIGAELTDIEPLLRETHSTTAIRNKHTIADPGRMYEPDTFDSNVPVYAIDLSLPPRRRYIQVTKDFLPETHCLPQLFDDILDQAGLPRKIMHFFTWVFLRRLHNHEQMEELKGIQVVTGVPLYLLVAYNVLLDLMMGCTSGAALTKDSRKYRFKMLHFRTLDWGMQPLRNVIVQFEYQQTWNGPVIARSIGYVGYVGILTAVKPGLSASLNFRPYHNDDSSLRSNLRYRIHQLLLLLGFRPSISSQLRSFFLPPSNTSQPQDVDRTSYTLIDIKQQIPQIPSTAAYLTFCDGVSVLLLEKDLDTAKCTLNHSFLAVTNHDISYEHAHGQSEHAAHVKKTFGNLGMEEVVEESVERKEWLFDRWKATCKPSGEGRHPRWYVSSARLKRLVDVFPVTNQQTHFSCVMDPVEGNFVCVRAYEEGEVGERRPGRDDLDYGMVRDWY